jgi:hypothetical protein
MKAGTATLESFLSVRVAVTITSSPSEFPIRVSLWAASFCEKKQVNINSPKKVKFLIEITIYNTKLKTVFRTWISCWS